MTRNGVFLCESDVKSFRDHSVRYSIKHAITIKISNPSTRVMTASMKLSNRGVGSTILHF